jgi:putative ABC transport system substrate-binding protein
MLHCWKPRKGLYIQSLDPLGTGLVVSLAHPGGNVTGLSTQQADIAAKRLELLREVVPGLRRLAIAQRPR